jgi:serine phosphatase RsbU (regulator of sigma subunit)/HAMP domain-containing protein
MLGVAVYIGNRIAAPVVDLARTEREFGQGNLDTRAHIHTHDELECLGDSFNDMASALQERTAQLNATLDTAHHQSERSEALYVVAQGLIVSMDLDERLEIIAHALASMVRVKRSSIFLRKGNRLVGAAGWNLMHPETFQDLVYDFSVGGRLIEEALAEGAPILVPDVRDDHRIDPILLGILDGFDVRALIALPLIRRNHLVGLVILDNPGEYAEFDPEGVENTRRLGDLAAIAIENAQVFEKERNVAHALQTSMLPQFCGRVGNFSFACEYHAALEVAQLGGDLYDLIELEDGRIGIVVADVSGKGLEAAVFTAMSKYTLRAFAHEDPEPALVLARANGSLLRAGGDWGFVTMAYSVLDMAEGRLVSANAGHPPYVHVTALGEVSELRTHEQNPPLGVFADIDYVQTHHRMELGDVLVGYTDGVSGARRDGECFEVERLARVISAHRYLPPEEIARAIYKAVLDYSQGSLQDDVALVVVKRDAQ